MSPCDLIRNDASLKSDADALVGILLEGGSMPWPKAIKADSIIDLPSADTRMVTEL